MKFLVKAPKLALRESRAKAMFDSEMLIIDKSPAFWLAMITSVACSLLLCSCSDDFDSVPPADTGHATRPGSGAVGY